MKQYSPHLLQVPFSSKRAPFFEPQYFFKTVKPAVGENIQMKWYSPDSKDFFLLAVNGLDAQLVKEIVCFLKSKVSFNTVESEAKDLKEMIETVEGFVEIEPSISPVQADTQSAPILSSTPLDATPAEPPIPATGFLHDVNTRIEENLTNEHFRGSELAKMLCCCEMQLYRKIKQLSRLSPANYIRRYRLHRSIHFLQRSDLTISQICFNVGFRSLEYFSRSFKKEFGTCPSAYRAGIML